MKRILALFAALVVCTVVAAADSYYAGYVNSDGYTWRGDGYWYYGDQAYTRQQVAYSYYPQYSNGYGGYYYSSYPTYAYKYQYYAYNAPKTPAPNGYKDPEWRSRLLDIAKQRDQFEGTMRQEALQQANYVEALQSLGLTGNFHWQSYGQAVQYPYRNGNGYQQQTTAVGSYGTSGNTQYGYSYSTVQDLVGDTALLNQAYAQSTQNAQVFADRAVSGLGVLADKNGQWTARVAETLARGEAVARTTMAAAEALRAAQGNQAVTQQTTTVTSTVPTGPGQGSPLVPDPGVGTVVQPPGKVYNPKQIPPDADIDIQVLYRKCNGVFKAKCISCHSGAEPSGKLDLTVGWENLSPADKESVLDRITTTDPKLSMPRTKDGGPGTPLSKGQIDLFQAAMSQR